MQCEDNSKLRTPLSEVCQTTDIGCVPITDGKPTCSPQPDELPFAFDPKTTTLWIFSCKTREWIAFGKFSVCQLNALNLENISNICDVLNIAVNYAGSGECQQGTVTLAELAERILECLKLETKIITIGEGEGNKVKISIDGLSLDPVYVTGRNIWSEGGSGTEADPLKIATYDPICKWPTKTQAQVDAANTKHLGACIDGEMARVPFPETDVCKSELLTLEQAQQRGSDLTVVGCDNGQVVRIPVSQSGFFDRDYICVPQTVGVPSDVPTQGTGPLRVDCNGNLYVWLCDSQKWLMVRDGIDSLSQLNPDNVPNICDNFRMKGWYSNNSDPCVQDVWFNLSQLATMLKQCGVPDFKFDLADGKYAYCLGFGYKPGEQHDPSDDGLPEAGSILRGRDLVFVRGKGHVAYEAQHVPNRYIVMNVPNNTDREALLSVDVRGLFFVGTQYASPASVSMVISDNLNIEWPVTSFESAHGIQTTSDFVNFSFESSTNEINRKAVGCVMAMEKFRIPPRTTKTIYVQHFVVFSGPCDGMDIRGYVDTSLYTL